MLQTKRFHARCSSHWPWGSVPALRNRSARLGNFTARVNFFALPLYGKPFTLKDDNDEISTLLFCILTAGAGLPFITKDLIVSRCGRESG
jgi:hypothetical protein